MSKTRWLGGVAAACIGACLMASSAWATSGVALVIGNSAYGDQPAIKTAYADADATGQTLQSAGYDVADYHDVKQADIGAVIGDLLTRVQKAGPDSVAFVYLSGYAVQYQGDDYFVPVDAAINKDADIPAEALKLSDLTDRLAQLPSRADVIIIDGSRANSYGQAANAPPAPGLALIGAPKGALIAYSTQPGAVVPEASGPYSLYAQTLNAVMRQPGLTVDQIFKFARIKVAQATGNAQTPWSVSNLDGGFRLFEPAKTASAAPPPAVIEAAPEPRRYRTLGRDAALEAALAADSLASYQGFVQAYPDDPSAPRVWVLIEGRREAILWDRALASDTPHGYWNYLVRFPHGPHAHEARERLADIRAALEPPPDYVVAPPPLPRGYYDEGVGLVEIVPEGAPPPPRVYGLDEAEFVPPPRPLPPGPLGYLLPLLPAFLAPPPPHERPFAPGPAPLLAPPPPHDQSTLRVLGNLPPPQHFNSAPNAPPAHVFNPAQANQPQRKPGLIPPAQPIAPGQLPPRASTTPGGQPNPTAAPANPSKIVLPPAGALKPPAGANAPAENAVPSPLAAPKPHATPEGGANPALRPATTEPNPSKIVLPPAGALKPPAGANAPAEKAAPSSLGTPKPHAAPEGGENPALRPTTAVPTPSKIVLPPTATQPPHGALDKVAPSPALTPRLHTTPEGGAAPALAKPHVDSVAPAPHVAPEKAIAPLAAPPKPHMAPEGGGAEPPRVNFNKPAAPSVAEKAPAHEPAAHEAAQNRPSPEAAPHALPLQHVEHAAGAKPTGEGPKKCHEEGDKKVCN